MGRDDFPGKYYESEEFFCNVSHELKAPLQEIALYAQVIEEDSGDLMLPQSREDLHAIRQRCESAMDMVQLFIKYYSIQHSVLNREVISLEELVSECFETLIGPLLERDITLITDSLPRVIGDKFLFRQMISNILSNSIKFTKGVSAAIIKVYSYYDDETTSFCFEDNGIGFNSKYAAKIFDLFERMHTEEAEGSGIGLTLVKSIVDRFGGDITIKAEENKGCTVTIKLPNNIIILPEKEQRLLQDKESKITIGVLGARSGEYSNIASCRKYAYELAVEEINSAGGINGKMLQLKYRDFHSDLSQVPEIAWELMAVEHADVIMGGQLSSARELIREVSDKMKIPYFFNALYEGGLADHYTFCISATPEQNIYPMLEYLFNLYGKKCYIVAADYNYGVLSAECTKDYIEKCGGTVIGIEYFSAQRTEFDATIENIKAAAPDILISFCVSNGQNAFYEQWYQNGLPDVPVVSTIGVGLSYLHRALEAPTMENTYFMSSYIEELDTPAALDFTSKLRKRHAESDAPYIEFDAETAYTAVYLYKKAVELAGSTECEEVIAALESGKVSFDGPGGRVIVRGEDHHVIRDEILFRVDHDHHIEKIGEFPALSSGFVERALKQELGITGGLKQLGTEAPNVQYNMMFNKII